MRNNGEESLIQPQQPASSGFFFKYLAADSTLFDLFLFPEYIGPTLFCLGFALWKYLDDDWKHACRGAELL
jgi:hypothetical protein